MSTNSTAGASSLSLAKLMLWMSRTKRAFLNSQVTVIRVVFCVLE